MGLFLSATEARDRILDRYGTRSGSLLNVTGTGTELVLWIPAELREPYKDALDGIFADNGELHISAFAPGGRPISPHPISLGGTKRALSGKLYAYGRMPTIEIDVTVVGNSVDYYKLSMLSAFYARLTNKGGLSTGWTNRADGSMSQVNVEKSEFPYLSMRYNAFSAPGSNVTIVGGMITECEPLMGLDGNAKISDRTFSFEFAAMDTPSWSAQKYDPTAHPAWYDEFFAT